MIDEQTLQLQHCMYQYSRAIYRSIKDLIDPYVDTQTQLEFRRDGARRVRADDGAARGRSALLRQARARALPGHPPLLPDHRAGAGRLGRAGRRRRRCAPSSRSRSRPAPSTAGSPAAARRRARASRASARRCPSATTARRTSISKRSKSPPDGSSTATRLPERSELTAAKPASAICPATATSARLVAPCGKRLRTSWRSDTPCGTTLTS